MSRRIYRYPKYIKSKKYSQENGKRFYLELVFNEHKNKAVIVVLKNPSKATDKFSDHTVNRVSNYIYNNQMNYKVFHKWERL